MENNNTNNSQEQSVETLFDYTLNLLVIEKKKTWEVKNMLVEQGATPEAAAKVVDTAKQRFNSMIIKKANKDMLFGALWCVGGIAVTAFTYAAASGGGRYVVTYGAIIWGGIQFFKGYSSKSQIIY